MQRSCVTTALRRLGPMRAVAAVASSSTSPSPSSSRSFFSRFVGGDRAGKSRGRPTSDLTAEEEAALEAAFLATKSPPKSSRSVPTDTGRSSSSSSSVPVTATTTSTSSHNSAAALRSARLTHTGGAAARHADVPGDGSPAQLSAHVAHLQRELRHSQAVIRRLVELVDRSQHDAELVGMEAGLEGGGGFFVAADGDALRRGLETPGARIVLLAHHTYLLDLFAPIVVRGSTTVSIIGNGATVVGGIAVEEGATLDVADVFFFAPNGQRRPQLEVLPVGAEPRVRPNARPEEDREGDEEQSERNPDSPRFPILSAINGSRLFVTGCTLVNGRDGVYLGVRSQAELAGTRVLNCVRGLYEGVSCGASIGPGCAFAGNYYHIVLLGPGKATRLADSLLPRAAAAAANAHAGTDGGDPLSGLLFARRSDALSVTPPGFQCVRPVWLRRTRADIVLQQDPIHDVYTECWLDGAPVELSEKDCTASLSDPVY